jgi:hypothetical protein
MQSMAYVDYRYVHARPSFSLPAIRDAEQLLFSSPFPPRSSPLDGATLTMVGDLGFYQRDALPHSGQRATYNVRRPRLTASETQSVSPHNRSTAQPPPTSLCLSPPLITKHRPQSSTADRFRPQPTTMKIFFRTTPPETVGCCSCCARHIESLCPSSTLPPAPHPSQSRRFWSVSTPSGLHHGQTGSPLCSKCMSTTPRSSSSVSKKRSAAELFPQVMTKPDFRLHSDPLITFQLSAGCLAGNQVGVDPVPGRIYSAAGVAQRHPLCHL